MKTPHDETTVTVDEMKDPVTGLHNLPPQLPGQHIPKPNVQMVDRARLLAAWDGVTKVMRGVTDQLKRNHSANRQTRLVTLGALVITASLGWYITDQVKVAIDSVHAAQQMVSDLSSRMDDRLLSQERKTDLLLNAMAGQVEAKLADDAAALKPKDPELKKEATRARVQALADTLAARKQVTPAKAQVAKADARLDALKVEASDKGLEVVVPIMEAPATAAPAAP